MLRSICSPYKKTRGAFTKSTVVLFPPDSLSKQCEVKIPRVGCRSAAFVRSLSRPTRGHGGRSGGRAHVPRCYERTAARSQSWLAEGFSSANFHANTSSKANSGGVKFRSTWQKFGAPPGASSIRKKNYWSSNKVTGHNILCRPKNFVFGAPPGGVQHNSTNGVVIWNVHKVRLRLTMSSVTPQKMTNLVHPQWGAQHKKKILVTWYFGKIGLELTIFSLKKNFFLNPPKYNFGALPGGA